MVDEDTKEELDQAEKRGGWGRSGSSSGRSRMLERAEEKAEEEAEEEDGRDREGEGQRCGRGIEERGQQRW